MPLWFACPTANAQSLEERLDSEAYLRGLSDLQLPEIIEHYLKSHPPADDVQAALQEIAKMQAALASHAVPAAERIAAVEALLAKRDELIAKHPEDQRRAIWLADQASDIFFVLLPIDAMNLAAILGLPEAEHRHRAAEAAARMYRAATEAEAAIDAAIRALEASPGFAGDIPKQQQRRHLSEVERDRRLPFLRGIATYLNAELNLTDATERAGQFELAASTLGPLVEALEGIPAVQARLYEGLALARLGRVDDARARFSAVAGDAQATPADAFAARLGGVISIAASRGPRDALEALDSVEPRYTEPQALFFRVLIADQRFLLRRDLAMQEQASNRARLLTDAFAAYTELLKANYPPGSVPRDSLRSIVFSRLVTASATPNLPLDQLPPIVAVAQADMLSREEPTREQAIMAVESVLESGALAQEDKAAALFVLGRALYEHGQYLLAARRFAELAREHPADSQAERAIELAVALAEEEHNRAPLDADATQLLRETLDLLLTRYPNLKSTDRWRYVAGRLALDQHRFDDAAKQFSQVTPEAAEWLDANFMQAATAREAAARAAGSADARRGLWQQALDAIARVQPVLERGVTAAASDESRLKGLRYYLGVLRVYRAEATLALGQAQQAIDALAGIEDEANADADVIGEAMKVRINAYQELRRPDEALRDLQRFVQNSPAQAGAVLQPMLASLRQDVQALVEADRAEEAKALANGALLPAAKTLETWLATPEASSIVPMQSTLLSRYVADAYRLAGQCEVALPIYERLLEGHPNSADILLGRAECLFELGGEQRLADAMAIYKRLGAAGTGSGAGGAGDVRDTWWLAQLRMLQILDQTNRNTQQILPRIERLRQGDPNFGSERYRRGFETLRAKHGSSSGSTR